MRSSAIVGPIVLAILLGTGGPVLAVEVSGSARMYGGTTKNAAGGVSTEQEQLNQLYNLTLFQPLAPYLSFSLNYRQQRFDTTTGDLEFDRKTQQPGVELLYDTPTFNALVRYEERRNRSTNQFQDVDITSAIGQFAWFPLRGPSLTVRLRDDQNVADVSVFGRDVRTRTAEVDVIHNAPKWWAGYTLQGFRLENSLNGIQLDQLRNEVRGAYRERFRDDVLSFFVEGRASRTRQTEEIAPGADINEVIRARAGLYALNIVPDVGSLDIAPDLVDGDAQTPAREGTLPGSPIIQIGGANTDRNIGLDLGFTRSVTQLEVFVANISDPLLQWQVWESSDNFTWTQVGGVIVEFDQAFLRYIIRFPEVVNRFFKVVNVSVNGQPDVPVTEIRALVDVTGFEQSTADAARIYTGVSVDPRNGVTGGVSLFYDNQQDLASGIATRQFEQVALDAQIRAQLGATVAISGFARRDRFKQDIVDQTQDLYRVGVDWEPLPNLETVFSVSRRQERQKGTLLRSDDTVQAKAIKRIHEGLTLTSDLRLSSVEDPFSGFQQETVQLTENLESRFSDQVRLSALLSLARFDFSETVDLNSRARAQVGITWIPAPALSILISLGYRYEDRDMGDLKTANQRYSVTWSPGTKLSVTGFYQDFNSERDTGTTSAGLGVNYRLNRYLTLFGNATRSRTDQGFLPGQSVSSVTFGVNLVF